MTYKKSLFGEFTPDGTILRDPEVSILSERPTQPGDVLARVPGTQFFYRVLATEKRQLTDEARAEIEAAVAPLQERAVQTVEAESIASKKAETKSASEKKDA